MCPCYLISEARFRELQGRLSPLLPWRELEPSFRAAHTQHLPHLLGPACLAELCARQATETLTPDDAALLATLEPYLAATILALWLAGQPSLRLEPTGTVVDPGDATHAPASPEQWRWLLGQAVAAAEWARAHLVQGLEAHRAAFPCLPPPNPCIGNSAASPGLPWGTAH
jgi:hypothetical protein